MDNKIIKNLPKISVGYRFGKLTVIEPTKERNNGYIIWRCRCDCGNDLFLDTRCIQRGTIQDCGCVSVVKSNQRDLTGKRFGKLICIEPTGENDKNGSLVWRCKCDCGSICNASSSQLVKGYKKSCGCLSHPELKNYIGKQFGKLTVIGYAGKRSGMHRWLCKCNCGNETIVGQTLLQSGKTQSCGCKKNSIIVENLKLINGTSVTLIEALKKHKLSSNTSGYTGVYQNKRNGKWVAQITFQHKTYYLGQYDDIKDAVKARKKGEEMHDNFLEWYHCQYG